MIGRPANGRRLRELIERHGLTRADVARLARVSEATVDAWLRPEDNAAHRRMPDANLELLALKLGEPSPFERHDARAAAKAKKAAAAR